MRWDPGHESEDVVDRRGESPAQAGLGGGGGGILALLPFLLRFKYGWVVVLLLLGGSYFTGMFGQGGGGSQGATSAQHGAKAGAQDQQARFVGFVLDDVQTTWKGALPQYRKAKLVLFSGATRTSCGVGQAATGPFYCPADEQVYIDLSFYDELQNRLGAGGDFAQAYVIAHEIGHHVQKILGVSEKVSRAPGSQQNGPRGLSVRLELQADCYAGMWAHFTQQHDVLEKGDIEEGLGAAAAIGDDRLQKQSAGVVNPESWTHGSSEQRVRWFKKGYDEGTLAACDTFSVDTP
jgi:predicted metalloprotease